MIVALAAMFQDGYTIVVIPLTALIEDWARRLAELKIPFERYHGSEGPRLKGDASIIIVSADMAVTSSYKDQILQLHQRRPVIRIVVDEAHFFFTDNNFRDALKRPYMLRLFPAQLVLLSGTIPPAAEQTLYTAFGITSPITFRSSTTSRLDLYFKKYPIEENIQDAIQQCQRIISDLMTRGNWESKDRYLIFVRSKQHGEQVSESLRIPFFHASMSLKDATYRDWVVGKHIGLIASNALSAGTDYSAVRAVIHVGSPFDMITYVQQCGRAGRDGQWGECHLIPIQIGKPSAEIPDIRGIYRMYQTAFDPPRANSSSCLRWYPTLFLDGETAACYELPDAVHCFNCTRREYIFFLAFIQTHILGNFRRIVY